MLHLAGAAGFLFFAGFLYRREKLRDPESFLKMVFMLAMFVLLGMMAEHAPEKIHLVMYFVLGLLLFKSVIPLVRSPLWAYLAVAVLCFIVGAADEAVQYFLPSRVFDVRDIIFNTAGGMLAVFFLNGIWYAASRVTRGR